MPGSPPGTPIEAPSGSELPDLPLVLRQRNRDRLVGAGMALALVGAPAAVALGAPRDWWQVLVTLFVGGNVGLRGWTRVVRGLRLDRSGLSVNRGFLVHDVPWPRLYGVRRVDGNLIIAWEPDSTARVGPFQRVPALDDPTEEPRVSAGPTAERVGALLMRLRFLSTAAGNPDRAVTTRLGSASAPAAYYPLVAVAAACLWHIR